MAKIILMRTYSQNKGVIIQAKKYWARALSGLALAKWHDLNFLVKMLSTFWLATWYAREQIKPRVVTHGIDWYIFFVVQIFFVWKKEKIFVGAVIESLSQSAIDQSWNRKLSLSQLTYSICFVWRGIITQERDQLMLKTRPRQLWQIHR